eukprot:NP_493500.1 Uncharacterized protein CELE_F49B2.3 [Caenorhabditis elegans]
MRRAGGGSAELEEEDRLGWRRIGWAGLVLVVVVVALDPPQVDDPSTPLSRPSRPRLGVGESRRAQPGLEEAGPRGARDHRPRHSAGNTTLLPRRRPHACTPQWADGPREDRVRPVVHNRAPPRAVELGKPQESFTAGPFSLATSRTSTRDSGNRPPPPRERSGTQPVRQAAGYDQGHELSCVSGSLQRLWPTAAAPVGGQPSTPSREFNGSHGPPRAPGLGPASCQKVRPRQSNTRDSVWDGSKKLGSRHPRSLKSQRFEPSQPPPPPPPPPEVSIAPATSCNFSLRHWDIIKFIIFIVINIFIINKYKSVTKSVRKKIGCQ